jgi:hypothetical protein
MVLIFAVFISWLISVLIRSISKPSAKAPIFAMITSVCFAILIYLFYSPTLKIVVPKGYSGDVKLILSRDDENILTVDGNGIGYINRWTYNKTYSVPKVTDTEGNDVTSHCIWFANNTFWARGSFTTSRHPGQIRFLSFKINQDTTAKTIPDVDISLMVDLHKAIIER